MLMHPSPAGYRLLAGAVVVIHLGFVAFVLLGALAVARWPRAAWVHLPCAAWGAAIEFAGWICPLTPLEQHLRRLGEQAGYNGGFVDHYLLRVLYPARLTREVQLALGALVIILNLGLYALAWRRAGGVRRPPAGH
jgi:hypothetical protein